MGEHDVGYALETIVGHLRIEQKYIRPQRGNQFDRFCGAATLANGRNITLDRHGLDQSSPEHGVIINDHDPDHFEFDRCRSLDISHPHLEASLAILLHESQVATDTLDARPQTIKANAPMVGLLHVIC